MSIERFAALRRSVLRLLYSSLLAGTNLSWLGFMRTSVPVLGWESMECVLHGEAFHFGSNNTIRNGLSFAMKQARARITYFS